MFALRVVRSIASAYPSSTSNRRHQRDLITVSKVVILIQKANIFVIHVDIKKPPHLALLIAQMWFQLRKAIAQPIQQFVQVFGRAIVAIQPFRIPGEMLKESKPSRSSHSSCRNHAVQLVFQEFFKSR